MWRSASFFPDRPLSDPGTPPMSESPWSLLPAASANAEALDDLYVFFWVVSGVVFIGVIGVQLYFMIKSRKPEGGHRKTSPVTHNARLELLWSAISAIFFLILFGWGEVEFMKQAVPPADAIDVRLTGQRWFWRIDYPATRGVRGSVSLNNLLIVPLNTPMRLTMTSQDVIHSFFIPAFRLKKDVVPGRYTVLWFEATKEGEYPLLCAEYCGDEHSSMVGRVLVVPADEYEEILALSRHEPHKDESLVELGARVFDRGGCASCHTLTGETRTGPSFKGLYGKTETLSTGATITVDDNYIRESVLDPNAKIVRGFTPQMPSFAGQFDEKAMAGLIEFVKAQK